MSSDKIEAVNDADEPTIRKTILQGFVQEDFERMIVPAKGPTQRDNILKAVANSFSAIQAMKRPRVTPAPDEEVKSASDEVAGGTKDVDELREALRTGVPHPQIKNLRRVPPKIGQKIQVTCPTHNIYWSKPGDTDHNKVIEPYYSDAASLGRQHVVLNLVEGIIGRAHYYAVQGDIARPEDNGPRLAYLNYRVRFFETDKAGRKQWTSGYNNNWWCKTLVDDSYFSTSDEEAKRRPQWVNDRRNERVIEDVSFKPVKHNPNALKEHKEFSKSAATRLRHGDSKDFINGVAMDIDSFVDFMIRQNKWIDETSRSQNKNRYRAKDFNTEDFTCNWDIKGIIHMLEVCSDYPRFALVTVRMKVSELSASDKVAGDVTPDGLWIDHVIGILAIQGHSRVKAHPHLFGWQHLDWKECPILFHQTDAANHQSIVSNGLYPGGPAKYLSRTEGHHRWCV